MALPSCNVHVEEPLVKVGIVALRDVKLPVFGELPPIAGGLAKYVENPVPETVKEAERVVNEPAAAVVCPMDILLMVLAVAGFNVTVPVPVGDIVTLAEAGDNDTVDVAVNVSVVVPPVTCNLLEPETDVLPIVRIPEFCNCITVV